MRRGLTLTEVLVITALVVVVALLVAMLPGLPRMWHQQRISRCLSNTRLLSEAMRLYLTDHDERFPFAGRGHPHGSLTDVWSGLAPYLSSPDVLLCPEDPRPAFNHRWVQRNGAPAGINEGQLAYPSSYYYPQTFYVPFDCSGGKNVPAGP